MADTEGQPAAVVAALQAVRGNPQAPHHRSRRVIPSNGHSILSRRHRQYRLDGFLAVAGAIWYTLTGTGISADDLGEVGRVLAGALLVVAGPAFYGMRMAATRYQS